MVVPIPESAPDMRFDSGSSLAKRNLHAIQVMVAALLWLALGIANAADAVNVIQDVKGSIVAVGTYQRTRSPAFRFLGTGFAVGDGTMIVTNSHVVPALLNTEVRETLVIVVSRAGSEPIVREVTQLANDRQYDLALLKLP